MAESRRRFLKGVTLGAGGVVLAPLVRRMVAHADGRAKGLPRRFVFVIKSSGLAPKAIRPVEVKRGDGSGTIDRPLKDDTLPETLQPLEAYKDQLLILEGLSGCTFEGNHSSYCGALSCHHAPEKPVAATVDCLLGKPNPAPFVNDGFAPNGHSIGDTAGPAVQETYQASAEKAYRQLFGSALDLKTGGKQEFDLHTNLLDFLAEDTIKLAKEVGRDEREKRDHSLEAFESVRARNEQLAGMQDVIKKNAPKFTSQYSSTVVTERVSTFFEPAAAALVTGLTNVITIRADWLSVRYDTVGFKTTSVHDIGHGKTTDNGVTAEKARDTICKFRVDLIAELAGRLKKVPEGDGTMLDNTMILYLSDTGEAHHSQRREWPLVVVGGRNMTLKTAGRYLRYPDYGSKGHKTIGNWYNTLLRANGSPPHDHFGQVDPNLQDLDLKGPLQERTG
jgi:hypothetical protein